MQLSGSYLVILYSPGLVTPSHLYTLSVQYLLGSGNTFDNIWIFSQLYVIAELVRSYCYTHFISVRELLNNLIYQVSPFRSNRSFLLASRLYLIDLIVRRKGSFIPFVVDTKSVHWTFGLRVRVQWVFADYSCENSKWPIGCMTQFHKLSLRHWTIWHNMYSMSLSNIH